MGTTLQHLFGKIKTFNTLRYYPDFRILWISNFSFQLGWWMQLLVMAWLAYEITNSAFLVALFTAVRLSPTLFGPLVGALSDKFDRRKILICAQGLQAAVAVLLAILLSTGLIQFWHLMVLGFLQGVIWNVTYTNGYALAMDIVGKANVTNAIALNIVAMDVTRVIGPAVGGLLTDFVGPATCFWIIAGLAILAVTVLTLMAAVPTKTAVHASALRNFIDGFNYVIRSRDMLAVLGISFTANIFLWPAYQSFMPIFAKENFGQSAEGLGFLLTTMGAGALVSAVVIASLGNIRRKGLLFLTGTALLAVFFGLFALSRSFTLGLALIGLAGLASSAFSTMQSTLMLLLAPEDMRARCMGFLSMAIGVYSFGSLALGGVASVFGVSRTTGASCAILFFIIIAIAVRFPNLRRL